ncbi:hypothetical protein ACFY2R_01625 [Micromonospora olivasterospora]|nr:hypothetical protein [Micromonospora olivasterospora]
MQMSSSRVWIFVEGKTDLYSYSKLADAVVVELGAHEDFLVASAEELAPDGGGKTVLMRFFDFLKKESGLVSDFAGRRTRAVFFLDKDVDDLVGRRRVSPHLIYTEHYSMENYLFRHGSIADASSAALCVPVQRIRKAIPDARAWRISSADLWMDWIVICLYAAKYGKGEANFGSHSKVNVNAFGPVAPSRLKLIEQQCAVAHRVSGVDPTQAFDECRQRVVRYYSAGRHDRVFNGKWYAYFLEAHLGSQLKGVKVQGLARHISSRLVQTLDFNGTWSKDLRRRLSPHLSLAAGYRPPMQRSSMDSTVSAMARTHTL